MNMIRFLIGLAIVYVTACLSYVMVVYDKDIDGKFVDYLAKVMVKVMKVMGISAVFSAMLIVGIAMMCSSCGVS